MGLSLLLPLVGPLFGDLFAPIRPGIVAPLIGLSIAPGLVPSTGTGPIPWIGLGWIATSVFLLALMIWTHRRMRAEAHEWVPDHLAGVPVWRSRQMGPAVVGWGPSRIVVPDWVLALERRSRRLIILHEGEHARSGDVPLLYLAWGMVILMPWNPVLWWSIRRLRLALEVDCDQRVLATGVAVRSYAEMLLGQARNGRGRSLHALAFAAPQSHLGRRIDSMTRPRPPRRTLVSAGVLAAAIALLLFACDSSMPNDPLTPTGADRASSTLQALREREVSRARESLLIQKYLPPYGIGVSTESDQDPLFFLDGKQIGKEQLKALDPARIREISVVKGMAAGMLARRGVIEIKSK